MTDWLVQHHRELVAIAVFVAASLSAIVIGLALSPRTKE